MRNHLPLLLLPAMILAAPACMAQARDGATDEAPAATAQEQAPQRSAFGRVMAVMIDALQQGVQHQEAQVDSGTTAIGTPLGIEVGEAFRLEAQPPRPAESGSAAQKPIPLAVGGGRPD